MSVWLLVTTAVALGPMKSGVENGLEYFAFPGVMLIIFTVGIHGSYGDLGDDLVIVLGSTAFWSLVTLFLIEGWRFIRRIFHPSTPQA
jgi:hypothetical protein